jgi:hypothetical protein
MEMLFQTTWLRATAPAYEANVIESGAAATYGGLILGLRLGQRGV